VKRGDRVNIQHRGYELIGRVAKIRVGCKYVGVALGGRLAVYKWYPASAVTALHTESSTQ
jgi:hypothetical protein